MLVHMTPREVQGLQSLAMAQGGSLTINPKTGLPEAGLLDSFLPTVLGIGATILTDGAISPLMAGLGVGGIAALQSGSLMKGLTAGLGAYGGAGLTSSLVGMAPEQISEASRLLEPSTANLPAGYQTLGYGGTGAYGPVLPPAATASFNPAEYAASAAAPTPTYDLANQSFDAWEAAKSGTDLSQQPLKEMIASPTPPVDDRALLTNQSAVTQELFGPKSETNLLQPWEAPPKQSYMDKLSAGTSEALRDPLKFAKANPTAAISAVSPFASAGLQALAKQNTLSGVTGLTANRGNIRPYQYTSGTVNPNFGKPGESYFLNQGYSALPVYAAAEGGLVPNQPGIVPDLGNMYPQSNIHRPYYATPVQAPTQQDVVSSDYDTQLNPFTGEERMAGGGQVSQDASKIYSDDPGMGPYSDSSGSGPYSDAQGVGPYSSTDMLRGLEAQFKKMSPSTLARYKKAKNAAMQAAAVKEEYARSSTVPDYDDTEIKMGSGGFLGIGGSGGEYTGGEIGPNSLLAKILGPAGQPSNIHEYGYNQGDQTYTDYGYDVLDEDGNPVLRHMAAGGMAALPEYAAGGKLLRGAGDGMSDDIPAVIKGKTNQRAALADGEFVIPADVVSHLGNGSTEAGAKRLYSMMSKVRKARTGNPKQGKQIQAEKYMPA